MVSWRWNDRPSKVSDVGRLLANETSYRLFSVGKYAIRVPDDIDGTIEYTVNDANQASSALPNLMVVDGEVRIAIEDLVPLILSRMEPAEIAEKLWADESVRDAFIYAATEHYSQMGIGQKDRRKLIDGLQQAVYNEQLDKTLSLLQSLEQRFGNKWFFWDQISQANDAIRNMCPSGFEWRLKNSDHDEQFKIVGTNWNEARAHWREELKALFPKPPEDEIEECPYGDDVPF